MSIEQHSTLDAASELRKVNSITQGTGGFDSSKILSAGGGKHAAK